MNTALNATGGSTACQEVGNCDMRTGELHVGHDELLCLFDRQPHGPHKRGVLPDLPFGSAESFRVGCPARSALSEPSFSVSPLVGRSDGAFFVSLTVAREREREGKEFPGCGVPIASSPFSHLFVLCQCLVVISSFCV